MLRPWLTLISAPLLAAGRPTEPMPDVVAVAASSRVLPCGPVRSPASNRVRALRAVTPMRLGGAGEEGG